MPNIIGWPDANTSSIRSWLRGEENASEPRWCGAPASGKDLRYNEFIRREMPQIGVSNARLAKAQK